MTRTHEPSLSGPAVARLVVLFLVIGSACETEDTIGGREGSPASLPEATTSGNNRTQAGPPSTQSLVEDQESSPDAGRVESSEARWTYQAIDWTGAQIQGESFSFAAPLESASALRDWQGQARTLLLEYLGVTREQPASPAELQVRTLGRQTGDRISAVGIDYLLEPSLRTRAAVLIPTEGGGPFPAVILWHGHDHRGPEAMGTAASELVEAGFVVMAPQIRTLSDEPNVIELHRHYANMLNLQGTAAMGVFLRDAWRAVDVLLTFPEVDPARVGTAGVSLGGQLSMLLVATDTRVKSAVVQGYLASYRGSQISQIHCTCQYVHGLGAAMDISDIALIAAPKPVEYVIGRDDHFFPLGEATSAFEQIVRGYRLLGHESEINLEVHDGVHAWFAPPVVPWFQSRL